MYSDIEALLLVIIVVVFGNLFGSYFYIPYLLDGVDIGAIFSRPRIRRVLIRWFILNSFVGLGVSCPILYWMDRYPLPAVLFVSFLIPFLAYLDRNHKADPLSHELSGWQGFLFKKIIPSVMRLQKWAIKPLHDELLSVNHQKIKEGEDFVSDLMSILPEDELKKTLDMLPEKTSLLPPVVREEIKNRENLDISTRLSYLVTVNNVDILRLLLRANPGLRDTIPVHHKIQQASIGFRDFIDSIQYPILHLTRERREIAHLNKKAKCFIEGTDEPTGDWSLISRTCSELFQCKEQENCPLIKISPDTHSDTDPVTYSDIDFPCKLKKSLVHLLAQESGYLLVKHMPGS